MNEKMIETKGFICYITDSFEKLFQQLVLRVSSGIPNTSIQMEDGLVTFICISVFGTPDETLALVIDILHLH